MRANVGWCWNHFEVFLLDSGEALLRSLPEFGGDGSWRYFSTHEAALKTAGLDDGTEVKYRGRQPVDESLLTGMRRMRGRLFVPPHRDPSRRSQLPLTYPTFMAGVATLH